MLDTVLAQVSVKLDAAEKAEVVANCDHLAKLKFSKVLPFAFTEHGAIRAAECWPHRRQWRWGSSWCGHSCACAS